MGLATRCDVALIIHRPHQPQLRRRQESSTGSPPVHPWVDGWCGMVVYKTSIGHAILCTPPLPTFPQRSQRK